MNKKDQLQRKHQHQDQQPQEEKPNRFYIPGITARSKVLAILDGDTSNDSGSSSSKKSAAARKDALLMANAVNSSKSSIESEGTASTYESTRDEDGGDEYEAGNNDENDDTMDEHVHSQASSPRRTFTSLPSRRNGSSSVSLSRKKATLVSQKSERFSTMMEDLTKKRLAADQARKSALKLKKKHLKRLEKCDEEVAPVVGTEENLNNCGTTANSRHSYERTMRGLRREFRNLAKQK